MNRRHVLFVVVALTGVSVPIAGLKFIPAELLILALAGFSSSNSRISEVQRKVVFASFVTLTAMLFSDVKYAELSVSLARPYLNMGLFVALLLAFLVTVRSRRDLVAAWGGLAVAGLLATVASPTRSFQLDSWKFGYALPVAIVLSAIAARWLIAGRPRPAALLLLGLGSLNVIMGYRSFAAVFVIGAVLALRGTSRRANSRTGRTPSLAQRLGLVASLALTTVLLSKLYSLIASSGQIGGAAQDKFVAQASGDYGVLLGARKELAVLGHSVGERPLLGLGSNGEVPVASIRAGIDFLYQAGYMLTPGDVAYLTQNPFPLHSALLASVVGAGVAGATLWSLLLWQVWRSLELARFSELFPVTAIIGLSAATSILLSPLGAEARVILALSICSVVFLSIDEGARQPKSRVAEKAEYLR